jgi:hypothetical protein
MTWHVDARLLERYAGGRVDEAHAYSIEAHLVACADCRERTAGLVDRDRLAGVWRAVEERVDIPRREPVEAVLQRVGVPDHVARLTAATPSLRLSWLLAVAACLLFALVAAHRSDDGVLAFLTLAALLPPAGVAAAYGPAADPTYEIGLASPVHAFRLLLLRAAAVLAATVALAGAAALALPDVGWTAAAWLLPGLAVTVLSLALATFMPVVRAFATVAALWVATVTLAELGGGSELAAFQEAGQVACLVVGLAAGVVLATRREALNVRRHA